MRLSGYYATLAGISVLFPRRGIVQPRIITI